jgi:hypothetical protein
MGVGFSFFTPLEIFLYQPGVPFGNLLLTGQAAGMKVENFLTGFTQILDIHFPSFNSLLLRKDRFKGKFRMFIRLKNASTGCWS